MDTSRVAVRSVMVVGFGGVGMGIGAIEAVVGGLAEEVDAEGDEGDAEARGGVAEVVGEHRVLPPLVPAPEKLPRRPQRLPPSTPHLSRSFSISRESEKKKKRKP